MKTLFTLITSIFLTTTASAQENSIKLGEWILTPIVLGTFEHDENLFRYDDKDVLAQALQSPNARTANLNVFLLDNGKQKILFDTGMDNSIENKLKDMGISTEEISAVVLTHTHGDHIGGLFNAQSKEPVFGNAKIYIASDELSTNPTLLEKYEERVVVFAQGDEIIEGITSIPALGHTLGHTAYKVENGGEVAYIAGDVLHAKMQFAHPDIYMTYDAEPENALEYRHRMLDIVSVEKAWIAGMHFTENGLGKVSKSDGKYTLIPVK